MPQHPYPPCFNDGCTERPCCAAGYCYSWPELAGKDAEGAIRIINETNPLVAGVKITVDEAITMPINTVFCCNRVYLVFTSMDHKVVKLPRVG